MPSPQVGNLTKIQRVFLEEYIKDYNGTQAYLRASPNKCSSETAKVQAHKILKKPEARAYLDQLEKELVSNLRITPEHIAVKLSDIAFYDETSTHNEQMKAIELLQKQYGLQLTKIDANVQNDIIINIE